MNKTKFARYGLIATTVFALCTADARATVFRQITAETTAPYNAVINSDGSLTENGVNYGVIYKPVPQASWVRTPWISPSQAFIGSHSIGLEIQPQTPPAGTTPADKVQMHLVNAATDSFAPSVMTGNKTYTGFAVRLPSAHFQVPQTGTLFQLAQWWQGVPYGPPVRLEITGAASGGVAWQAWVFNNSTNGNPSSVPIVIGSGTIPFDTWTTFVFMVIPTNFTGAGTGLGTGGEIKVWQNGSQLLDWSGQVGYNPTTIPYINPPQGTVSPNKVMDVFFGPYRDEQPTDQQQFFDEIQFASTYAEAEPLNYVP